MDMFCAMIALLLRTSKKVAGELGKGKLDKVYLKLKDGAIVGVEVSSNAILAVLTSEEENVGLVFNRMDKAAEKINKILD